MSHEPAGDSDADFELARRAVDRGWVTRDQVELALIETEITPGSRLLNFLPLTPDQLRRLDVAPASVPEELSEAAADPGRRVAQYVLGDHPRSGGMGRVYKAWDLKLSRWVALKFLKKPGRKARHTGFEEEARLAAGLSHPNIAAVYEIGDRDGEPFIAMQFIEGRTLAEARRGLKPREAARIMRDTAQAVDFAHGRGVIHRDLKPSNVMLDGAGRVFVMDFGLATHTVVTGLRTVSGTPGYLSPEQARGGEVDERTDVYGLGATLYELVTGRPPTPDKTMVESVRTAGKSEIASPRRLNPKVEADLETIMLKCLDRDPDRRYSSAKRLADDLERFLNRDPIAARPPSLTYRLRRNLAKRKTAMVAALAVAAMIGTAIVLIPRWRSEATARAGLEDRRSQFERARPHLEAGRLILLRMKRRMHEAYTPSDLDALGAQAQAQFRLAREAAPDHPEPHFGSATAHALVKDLDRAVEALERAIKADPSFGPAYLDRARLLIGGYEDQRHESTGLLRQESQEARRLRERIEHDLGRAQRTSMELPQLSYARGLLAFAQGREEKAIAELERYLQIDPEDAEAHYWRGHALVHLGRYTEAIQSLTRAIACDTRYAAAIGLRGVSRSALGFHDQAIQDYTKAIEVDPRHPSFWINRGNANLRKGSTDAAIADFTKVIEIYPGLAYAWRDRGFARHTKGLTEEALVDYNRAIDLDPRDAISLFNRGILLTDYRGRHEEAIADFTRSLELNPRQPLAHNNRGIAKVRKGHIDEAIADFERAIQMDPNYANAHANLEDAKRRKHLKAGPQPDRLDASVNDHFARARALQAKGLHDETIAEYSKVVRLRPNYPEAWANRGNAKARKGDLAGAVQDWKKALEAAPSAWSYRDTYEERVRTRGIGVLIAEGHRLHQQKRHEEAVRKFDLVLQSEPTTRQASEAYSRRGVAKVSIGLLDEALADCQKGVDLEAGWAARYIELAVAKSARGSVDEALADLEKAVALDPKDADVYHSRGLLRKSKGLIKEALEDFDQAIFMNPKGPEAYLSRGAVLNDSKRLHEQAIRDFEKVIELQPGRADAFVNLGIAKSDSGRVDEAILAFSRAIELNPGLLAAYLERGAAMFDLGHYDEAIRDADKATELQPGCARAWRDRGIARCRKGLAAEGLQDIAKAIDLDPKDPMNYVHRGAAFGDLGRHDESLAALDTAVALDSTLALAWHNRGHTKFLMGLKEEAIADLNEAIKHNPAFAQSHYLRGNALNDLGRIEEAIESYSKAIERNPKHAEAFANRGNQKARKDLIEEAMADWSKALDVAPPDWSFRTAVRERIRERGVGIVHNEAHRLYGLKRYREAIEKYRRVVAGDPKARHAIESAFDIASCHLLLGEKDAAFDWLEKAVAMGWKDVAQLERSAHWGPFRQDKRYRTVVDRLKRN